MSSITADNSYLVYLQNLIKSKESNMVSEVNLQDNTTQYRIGENQ